MIAVAIENKSRRVPSDFGDDRWLALTPIVAPLSLVQQVREFADPLPLKLMPCRVVAFFEKSTPNREARFPLPVYPLVHRANNMIASNALMLFEPNVVGAKGLPDVSDLPVAS
jgi:hypothetical protein